MKKCRVGTEIQSVRFDSAVWTAGEARRWLLDHGFQSPRVDRTNTQLRYRQLPPSRFEKGSFRTIDLDKSQHISAVIGCPKPGEKKPKVIRYRGMK
jgi:hypothetical protein